MPNTNYQTIHQMGSSVNYIIRQASGRDEVQNIDMDFVTVARNHCAVHEEYSGSEVSFEAQTVTPMGLIVQVNPVQDLHGQDAPYPPGGGKNLFNPESTSNEFVNTQNVISTLRGAKSNRIPVSEGQKYVLSIKETVSGSVIEIAYLDDSDNVLSRSAVSTGSARSISTTAPENATQLLASVSVWSVVSEVQLELANSATTYSPYSNICPISGWTGANVTLSPTTDPDDPDKEVYAYTFPTEAGTVYGGTLTVNKDGTGELVVEWANIASYNGETLPGRWISDRDVYAQGTTPTTGAQVVYELATPVTYTLSSLEVINTLKGTNNVFADTGDITVQFTDIVEDY